MAIEAILLHKGERTGENQRQKLLLCCAVLSGRQLVLVVLAYQIQFVIIGSQNNPASPASLGMIIPKSYGNSATLSLSAAEENGGNNDNSKKGGDANAYANSHPHILQPELLAQ